MENLINKIEEIPKDKKVFVFDLDGTLAESKVNIDEEMGELLNKLLAKGKVAIIGGASFEQMYYQLPITISKNSNLSLLPLDGGSFYFCKDSVWHNLYFQTFTEEEKKKTFESLELAMKEAGYVQPSQIYGDLIEDRGGQITWSALGQHAPLQEKEKWERENLDVRSEIVSKLNDYLPEMEAKVAGVTSVDVTKKGIDKKFGIEQIIKYLGVSKEEVIFFGDAIVPDGNDYPALESGVVCYKVASVDDTKQAIRQLLA